MHAAVVEVVARIADSVVDLAHVEHGGQYRIGTAPEVELAIVAAKLRSFPILDAGFLFRRPAGFTAQLHIGDVARPIVETELRLEAGWRVELALGLVVVELAIIERRVVPVPRPRPEIRPWVYGGVVLAAHLAVWAAAMVFVPLERLGLEMEIAPLPPRIRVSHVEEPPPPPPPPPKAATQAAVAVAAAAPPSENAQLGRRKVRAIAGARKSGVLGATGLGAAVSSLVPHVDVKKLVNEAVAYDEEAANRNNFGNGLRLDLGGIVMTGDYSTVSTGKGAGEQYDLPGAVHHPQPDITMCKGPCRVDGATARDVVHHEVDLRIGALGYCYQQHAEKQLSGSIEIAFTIGEDGAVHDAKATGMSEIDDCAAGVISVIPFPPQETSTTVSYTFAFRPSS